MHSHIKPWYIQALARTSATQHRAHTSTRQTTCNLNTSFWARHGLHGVEKQKKLEESVAECSLLQQSSGSAPYTLPEALNTLQISPRAIEPPPLTSPTDSPREHARLQSGGLVPGTIADYHTIAVATAVGVTHRQLVDRQRRIQATLTDVACAL